MNQPMKTVFAFDGIRVDAAERRVWRGDEPVVLMPKAFELLLLLVGSNGQLLDKGDLMRRLWPDTFVEEANLNVHISAIRKALGESAQRPRYIATIPGRGYRFTANLGTPQTPRRRRPFFIASAFAALLVFGVACALYVQRTTPPPPRPTNAQAHRYTVMARHYWNKRDAAGLRKAIELFQRAIDEDPQYAPAFVGLADSYSMLGDHIGTTSGEYRQQAHAAAMRAVALDDHLAEAHATLGYLRMRNWQWSGVEGEFRRAIEIDPRYATAHQWYSIFLELQGRPAEAVREAQRAQELDPLSPIINESLSSRLYFARQYDRALAQARKTTEIAPFFADGHETLARVYMHLKMREAFAQLDRPERNEAVLGHAYARFGRTREARAILAELQTKAPEPVAIAMIHAELGDRDRALQWLQRAREQHADHLVFIKVDPTWDGIRSDPRFAAIVRSMGLKN